MVGDDDDFDPVSTVALNRSKEGVRPSVAQKEDVPDGVELVEDQIALVSSERQIRRA